MRDVLYIACLFLAAAVLSMDFPVEAAKIWTDSHSPSPFASYVELSPQVHAACIESARTSWQVRSGSKGRPSIGSLDSGVPLLSESLPPRETIVFRRKENLSSPVGPVRTEVYSLMPLTSGADIEKYSSAPPSGKRPSEVISELPFSAGEMLSTENSGKLKEIMQ
ncbi:MAG: hypothetical protein J6R18_09950 [Kiritimatiellae bacterium]|nr:hypothetical protein [Kiritimatiellia bacterium]